MDSLIGGLSLGTLAFSRLALSGRVLGISGIMKGILDGNYEAWRTAFVSGLIGGAALLAGLLPSAFETFPASYTFARAISAGLLVGVGTAMGSGCTSGHGICGNSRLSVRSIVATVSFMASGAISAFLSGIASVFGLPKGIAPITPPGPAFRFGIVVLAVATAANLGLAMVARFVLARSPSVANLKSAAAADATTPLMDVAPTASNGEANKCTEKLATVAVAGDLFSGALFALGLGVSGMVRPSKVAAFLSVLSGTFDPSLMFVMGGALAVSLPATLFGLNKLRRPLCCSKFMLPVKQAVDWELVMGSLLFGMGWGLGGICPGPGLVAMASLQPKSFAFVGAMAAGMKLWSMVLAPATARKS